MYRLITLIIASAVFPAAHAQICLKPSEPYCLDATDIDESCRWEVESYLRELDTYFDCLSNGVLAEKKKVINKWNCRIKGHSAGSCF